MKSRTTAQFRNLFRKPPKEIREDGRKAYKLFQQNPHHPSLQFKKITGRLYSARINLGYRVAGTLEDGEVVWFWAGSHADYDKLVARFRKKKSLNSFELGDFCLLTALTPHPHLLASPSPRSVP